MSGVNPTAAAAAAANAAAEAAIAMELQALAQDAQALRALLMTGDIVQATVQPFNGISDTLEIFGLRVAASLPANLLPGDALTVSVQGFKGDQVLVQVMSRTPAAASSAAAQTATTPTTTSQPQTVASPPQSTPPPAPVNTVTTATDTLELTRTPIPVVVDEALLPPVLPPPSRGALEESTAESSGETEDEQTAQTAAAPPTRTMPQAPRIVPQAPVSANADTLSVEARLALSRAATPGTRAPIPPPAASRAATPPSSTIPPPRPAATTPSVAARTSLPPVPPRTQFAPIITTRPDAAKPSPQPIPGAPAQARPTTTIPPSQTRVSAPTAEELLEDPVQLLRTLRIPVTPTTQTFAKLVTTQPEQVATALQALEQSLPDSDDPRITTLRTLAAFVGKLDPESPTFETQVQSYIAQVVEGPEQKLLALVQPQQPAPPAAAQGDAPAEPAAPLPAATPAQATPQDPTATAARVATSVAATDADLKTQLLAVLAPAQPENALGETGAVVARNALTGLVANQLSVLASQQSQPPSWTFTIPISVDQQLYPAKIQVSRDAPEGKGKQLSTDDFHIAFILDTKRFGTIGIDLHAVQRSVSVTVRTERPSAASTFKSAMAKLGTRLESLKYNVKALDAHTTKTRPTFESQAPPPSDTITMTDSKA